MSPSGHTQRRREELDTQLGGGSESAPKTSCGAASEVVRSEEHAKVVEAVLHRLELRTGG